MEEGKVAGRKAACPRGGNWAGGYVDVGVAKTIRRRGDEAQRATAASTAGHPILAADGIESLGLDWAGSSVPDYKILLMLKN